MTSYKNRLVNSQKPSSIKPRPGKQLVLQQLAAAIQQQQYQQYMRKTDFILQHTDPVVENNYTYDFNYEEPEFILDDLRVIEEEPKFIPEEEPKFILEEEPDVMEKKLEFIQEDEEPHVMEKISDNCNIIDNNTNEIQQTTSPINININIKNNYKKKKFNTDKINTIIETDKEDPFKVSRKSMIEKVISTLITKFMISRQQ